MDLVSALENKPVELNIDVEWPSRKFLRLFEPCTYSVWFGGRGGAKSHSIAQYLVLEAASTPQRILCAREIQKSITESVHQLLCDKIQALNLSSIFTINNNSIECKNGSQIIFAGLRTNVSEIKSLERIDLCWVEEAQAVSAKSWKLLIPTVLRQPNSKIIISFNPDRQQDPTSLFVLKPRPNSVVVKVGWQDNPFLSEKMVAEKDHMYATDPETAANVWGGEFVTKSNAQIMRGHYSVRPFEVPWLIDRKTGKQIMRNDGTIVYQLPATWEGPYVGADWGFSNDPGTLVETYIETVPNGPRRLYVRRALFYLGTDLPVDKQEEKFGAELHAVNVTLNAIPELWRRHVPRIDHLIVRGDNSRPETIDHISRHNLAVVPAQKWPGSVEDGITYLHGFDEIVIHPECVHLIHEALNYSYKVDKQTEEVLPDIEDKFNHGWDAIRYALDPFIRKSQVEHVETYDADEIEHFEHELDRFDAQFA